MKRANILIFFSLILFTSCGGVKTYTDYDETLDYNQFKTFDFYDPMETGLDDLDEKRLKTSLREVLAEEGFEQQEDPDFMINFYSESYQKKRQHNIGVRVGTFGRNVGGSLGSGIPINSSENIINITVEFAETANNELFWQGVAEGKLSPKSAPEERRAYFKKAIQKLLKSYPPKSK
ncbi:MAG TPA: DUF4136 domain-containing protein [Flavobacteriaceae bacterium]|nr:DUF4136 domain-containing protein [Flavobacteriaceae bacterium]